MLSAYPSRRSKPLGYVVLGALSPDDATNQIFPKAKIRSGAGHNQQIWNDIRSSAAAGEMLGSHGEAAYIPGSVDCAAAGGSTGPNNVQLAQVGGSLALTGINVAAALSTTVATAIGVALGPATLGISAIIGLFPLFFGHHAAAVKREQSVLCSAVPAANNYLQIIDQAVQQGKVTPQQAIAALQSLVSDFQSQVSSIMQGTDPTSQGECNAACVMLSELRAIALVKQSQYQDLAAANPQSPMTSGSGPSSSPVVSSGSTLTIPAAQPTASSSPNWLGLAAIVGLGFFAWKAL